MAVGRPCEHFANTRPVSQDTELVKLFEIKPRITTLQPSGSELVLDRVKECVASIRKRYASPEATRLSGVVRVAAPLDLSADAGLPYRAKENDQPESGHKRLSEQRV